MAARRSSFSTIVGAPGYSQKRSRSLPIKHAITACFIRDLIPKGSSAHVPRLGLWPFLGSGTRDSLQHLEEVLLALGVDAPVDRQGLIPIPACGSKQFRAPLCQTH